jgi:hypothetical protein
MVFVAWVLFIHILLHIVWILDLVGTYQYCISVYLFTYRSDTGIANFHTRWVLVLDWYVPFHIPIWSWYLTGIGPKADLCLVWGMHKPSIKIDGYQVGFNSEDLPVWYWYKIGIASVDTKLVCSFIPAIHIRTYIIPRLLPKYQDNTGTYHIKSLGGEGITHLVPIRTPIKTSQETWIRVSLCLETWLGSVSVFTTCHCCF